MKTRTVAFAITPLPGARQLLSAFLVTLAACQPMFSLAADHCPLPRKPVTSLDAAVDAATKAATAYKLLNLPIACVKFDTYGDGHNGGPDYNVVVREKHSEKCGGDPQTEPRILTIIVRPDGRMSTDVYDLETFKPLVCPKGKYAKPHSLYTWK
jgi:hypothetical protein